MYLIEIDECDSIPCQNGGTCNDYINFYNCSCQPGYDGVNCETGIIAIFNEEISKLYIYTCNWVLKEINEFLNYDSLNLRHYRLILPEAWMNY